MKPGSPSSVEVVVIGGGIIGTATAYFLASLGRKVTLFEKNNFKFTIHNLENKDMVYIYEVYIDANR
jgi:pyruvate/2-oxoglutarate dehydrogenase complex dihydrolipoamide dehydrogenase (E3) component